MDGIRILFGCFFAAGGLWSSGGSGAFAAGLTAETVCEFARNEQPEGLSALSRIGGDRYYSVNDRGGELYELEIRQNATGEVVSCSVIRKVCLAGRKDLEGCAWDPLEKRVWVSDESDTSVRQFDPTTGRETAAAAVPEVYAKNVVDNRSLEALAISPDGLRMYVANEDTLKCDGPVASQEQGGVVRIQEFVRTGAGTPWRASRQFRYPTEKIDGEAFEGNAISGVAAICAEPDGTLLVLEREMSMKNPLFPSFHARLFQVRPTSDGATLEKHSVWDEDTMFSNYEGICRGSTLKSGARTWILVSDGGGKAEENLLVIQETR